jgi:drug/metabolite transporter (DMT)-like permease
MNYLLIALNIVLLVGGQTLWKIGLEKHPVNGLGGVLAAMVTPWVVAGIGVYVIATVVWIYLLSKLPISLLYPLQSLAYVTTVVVAIFVFHEHVSIYRWVGVAIVLVGVGFIVK